MALITDRTGNIPQHPGKQLCLCQEPEPRCCPGGWQGKPPQHSEGIAFLWLLRGLLGGGADTGARKGAEGKLHPGSLLSSYYYATKISGQVAE